MRATASVTLDFIDDLTPEQQGMLDLMIIAHQQAARENQNVSKAVVLAAHRSSGSFLQGACAGMLTVGRLHAPIRSARILLRNATMDQIEASVKLGAIIPGFGNSFFKDRIDPAFQPLMDALSRLFPALAIRITALRDAIWRAGKKIWPNAAILTAAVCELLAVPDGLEDVFFMIARIPEWASATVKMQEAT